MRRSRPLSEGGLPDTEVRLGALGQTQNALGSVCGAVGIGSAQQSVRTVRKEGSPRKRRRGALRSREDVFVTCTASELGGSVSSTCSGETGTWTLPIPGKPPSEQHPSCRLSPSCAPSCHLGSPVATCPLCEKSVVRTFSYPRLQSTERGG